MITFNISNSSMEQSLRRIADSLESTNELLKKLTTAQDFSEEDASVKAETKIVRDAIGRIPGQK